MLIKVIDEQNTEDLLEEFVNNTDMTPEVTKLVRVAFIKWLKEKKSVPNDIAIKAAKNEIEEVMYDYDLAS